ncbi:hypothetical protein KBX06_21230 [Micromonospora sp. C31]|uniref:hypothetical protein n=1 Tax=Micromonospora sp. C31 TaxID=2824876 RepID=UPI001B36BF74|nr:hypothetical protein [Micromonospora sp. C31]
MFLAHAGNSRPDVLAAAAPALAWKRRSCVDGAKGPRLYDWAVAALPGIDDSYGHWLLIRRSITDPTDLAYYLHFGPAETLDEVPEESPKTDRVLFSPDGDPHHTVAQASQPDEHLKPTVTRDGPLTGG